MYTLYSMQRSGNSYKARLALAQLDIPYRRVEIDILRGESRTPEFLAKNPSGQIPLLEVAPGRYIAESNAILWYVAGGTALAPEDRIDRADALQWMFFEQHSLEPNIGAAYFWLALVRGGRELQQQFRLVVNLPEQERHRRMEGVALCREEQAIKLDLLVPGQLEVDDHIFLESRQCNMLGMFQDFGRRLAFGMA